MSDVSWPEIVAHRDRLIRIARKRCPTHEDAEDVVHEAMVRCATFEGLDPQRLGAFLTTVTMRLCADLYRETERSQRAVLKLDLRAAPDPEDEVVRAAEAAVLADLLSTLPASQRAVLVDRAYGMTLPQICTRHALTYPAVESALSRARRTMRGALAAAFSALAAGVAVVRRRPVEIAAVPVAALAVVGTIVAAPFGRSGPARAASIPDAPRVPLVFAPAAKLVDVRRIVASRPVAPSRVVATRPVARPAARPHHDPILDVSNHQLGTRTRVDDGRKEEPPADTVARCVNEGVWVSAEVSPETVGVKQGCGAPPGWG